MHWVIIAVVGVGILVVALVVMRARAERARTEGLHAASLAMGFDFEGNGDLEQIRALGDLPLYSHGHSKQVKNVMTGRSGGAEARVFDYQYTTGGGKESHTWMQTVALYPGAATHLPDFVLSPENVFHKIGQMLGYQDIDFESSPGFSSRYLLRGPDEPAIRAAFTVDTRTFFEQEWGWTLEVRGGSAGIYRAGKRVKPEELGTFLQQARTVLTVITRR